jgi:hypothetical protein
MPARWTHCFGKLSSACIAIIAMQTGVIGIAGAQVIPAHRVTNWLAPGAGSTFTPQTSVIITDFGADPTGVSSTNAAMQAAIGALGGPGEVLLPPGTFRFDQGIILPDSIILQGTMDDVSSGPLTTLVFSVGENVDCIRIAGGASASPAVIITPLVQGMDHLVVDQPELFQAGQVIRLIATDDVPLVNDAWSHGQTGQILVITQVSGDMIHLERPLRRSYSSIPTLQHITPRRQVHLRCLAIEREVATSTQTVNVYLSNAFDCTISGIRSFKCNYAHINIFRSARITVENSFFKEGHSYGGGGKAYGVLVDFGSGDNFIHKNTFERLRHAMLLQAGANGNVFAYNRSIDPFWSSFPLPSNSAGDLVLHGNYPYMNLFEGNVVQNIVIDNSHAINGPYNTFFRNRAELYGIFMNTSPASNDQNFIGNQVTNTSAGLGLYTLQGTGHFTHGNQIKGTIQPPGTGEPDSVSLFGYGFSGFYSTYSSIPPIRNANWQASTPLIESQYRWQVMGKPAVCTDTLFTITTATTDHDPLGSLTIFPNPTERGFRVHGLKAGEPYTIMDASGRIVLQALAMEQDPWVDASVLAQGLHVLLPGTGDGRAVRFAKE